MTQCYLSNTGPEIRKNYSWSKAVWNSQDELSESGISRRLGQLGKHVLLMNQRQTDISLVICVAPVMYFVVINIICNQRLVTK